MSSTRPEARTNTLLLPTESSFGQMIRFGIAGGAATVVDMGLLWTLINFAHLWYVYGVAVGYAAGTVVSYVISVKWIFPHRAISDRRLEFIIFTVVGVIALGLTELVVAAGVEWCHLSVMVSKLVSVVLIFLYNFWARKIILFPAQRSALNEGQ
jgi:putative flippase GtrA